MERIEPPPDKRSTSAQGLGIRLGPILRLGLGGVIMVEVGNQGGAGAGGIGGGGGGGGGVWIGPM